MTYNEQFNNMSAKALEVIENNIAVAEHDYDDVTNEYQKEQVEALQCAAEALRFRIQKKVIIGDTFAPGLKKSLEKYGKTETAKLQSWCCPTCRNSLVGLTEAKVTCRRPNCCDKCGQSLNWEDTYNEQTQG